MNRRTSVGWPVVVTMSVVLGVPGLAYAAPTAAAICSAQKAIAVARAFACVTRERVGEFGSGHAADIERCSLQLHSAFERAELSGGCGLTGDADDAAALVNGVEDAELIVLEAAATTSDEEKKCAAAKNRAAVKYVSCRVSAAKKLVLRSVNPSGDDWWRCAEVLLDRFEDAEAGGACLTSNDGDASREVVDPLSMYLANSNLAGADLIDAELSGAFLKGANLSASVLRRAGFDRAVLTDANLSGADLTSSYFSRSDLTGADLSDANLSRLRATRLRGCPTSLPANWSCKGFALLGPNALLSGEDLSGADLSSANLSDADLYFTDLSGANLSGVNFDGASLWHADLSDANLTQAKLSADLYNANLTNADLDQATLTNAVLTNASLAGVNLGSIDLTGVRAMRLSSCPAALPAEWACLSNTLVGPNANLSGASSYLSGIDLSGANLTGANLSHSYFDGTDLSGANLDAADLRYASFNHADLSGVDLSGATVHGVRALNLAACPAALPAGWICRGNNLFGPAASFLSANFVGADLSGLDLTGADFSYADLTGADFSNTDLSWVKWHGTTCPDGTFISSNPVSSCCEHLVGGPPAACP